jgi:uncharacterized protein involved in type VI secretion and phage assembly
MNLLQAPPAETGLEAGGFARGLAVAIVTQNQDPDGLGRVRVRFPWFDGTESHWARLAAPMAGKDRGLVLIPEVGDEVLVGFEREDLRFPYILGGVWNGVDTPPYANDDGNNDKRLLKSRKGHTLTFDDGDQGVVELRHENGGFVKLTDDGITVDDGQGNTVSIDNKSGAMKLQASGSLEIKAATITIEATGTLDLKANATMTIRGALVNIN